MKCLACGSEALVKGTVLDSSDGGALAFMFDDVSSWKTMLGMGTRKIRAYGCVYCQHLQLAVDFTEKDLLQYQQFEGEKSDVLKGINSWTDTCEKQQA